jgi:hypothetical protein
MVVEQHCYYYYYYYNERKKAQRRCSFDVGRCETRQVTANRAGPIQALHPCQKMLLLLLLLFFFFFF